MVAVAGASGGTKIITAVAQVLFRAFYLGQVAKISSNRNDILFEENLLNQRLLQTIKEAVDARRFHHQLFPMNLNYEDGVTTVRVLILSSISFYQKASN